MKVFTVLAMGLFAIICLSNYAVAQSLEVPTGPFIDSDKYLPPNPLSSKNNNGAINITNYKQCGQAWSNANLGTCTDLVCKSGCAMTDAAILLKANGVNIDPGQLNTWLTNNSGYASGCNIYWAVATNYPSSTITWYGSAAYSLSILKSEIDGGNPVIVNVDHPYGGSGTCNHYVVVYGYSNSGTIASDFLVSDPGTVNCPTGCNLSYYTICSTSYPLRVYHNVTAGGGCALTGLTPTLISPGSISAPGTIITNTTPTLSWNPVTGATNYDVYVSISPYGSSHKVFEQLCVTGTSLVVPSGKLSNNNLYRWNIQANLSCTSCSSLVSAANYFQINTAPQLTALITNISVTPTVTTQCAIISISYTINSNGNFNVILGASIRLTGTSTDYQSDPANDKVVSLAAGIQTVKRDFRIFCPLSTGSYDLISALWIDKNGNNVIDGAIDTEINQVSNSGLFSVTSGCTIVNITPTLVSPGSLNGPGSLISTTTPTLSWNPVPDATNYDVYVSISPYGSSHKVF